MAFYYESKRQKLIRQLGDASSVAAHEAFEGLWWPLEPMMLGAAVGKLISRADAEDVVAHVRHQMWHRRAMLSALTESEFEAYLWTIHANRVSDYLKKRHREPIATADLLAAQHLRINEVALQARANAEERLLNMVPTLRSQLLPQLVRQQPTILREVSVRLDDGWVHLGRVCDEVSVQLVSARGDAMRPGYVRAEWYAVRFKLDQMLKQEGMRPKSGAVRILMLSIGRSGEAQERARHTLPSR